MNCRTFERDLPEWIADRLSPVQAKRMQDHHAVCTVCQEAAQDELVLRRQWQCLPSPALPPMLWPRLAEQIAVSTPRRRVSLRIAAFGGIVVAAGVCSLLFWLHAAPMSRKSITPAAEPMIADERPLVQMVNKMQQIPEDEIAAFLSENESRKQAQYLLLLGKEEE